MALHLAHGAWQHFSRLTFLLHALDDRIEDLAHFVDEARNRGVRTDRIAVAATRAVLRDELRVLEANTGHVTEQGGHRGHDAEADKRVGQVVAAHAACVKVPCLLPEAVYVSHRRLALRQALDHDWQRRLGRYRGRSAILQRERFLVDLLHFVETAPDDSHVVFDDACALVAKLVLQLVINRFEQLGLIQAFLLEHRRCREERALECDSLHAQLQICVGRFVTRNAKRIEVEHANIFLDDDLLERDRDRLPDLVGIAKIALNDEGAAFFQPRERIRVMEYIRVG